MDELVYQHSVFATTCELARVGVPKSVEFPGLAGWLKGGSGPKNESVFCYYRDFQRSVRTKEFKLIVYPQAGRTQLFDLKRIGGDAGFIGGGAVCGGSGEDERDVEGTSAGVGGSAWPVANRVACLKWGQAGRYGCDWARLRVGEGGLTSLRTGGS